MEDSDNSESDEFESSQLAYHLKNRPSTSASSRGRGQKYLGLKLNKPMAQSGPQIVGSKPCQANPPTTSKTSTPNSANSSGETSLRYLNNAVPSYIKNGLKTGQSTDSKTSDRVSNTNNLRVHDVRQIPSSSKSLVCSHCDKHFADPVVLTEHLYKVIEENASEENERLSNDEEMNDEDTASLNEEVVEKSPRIEELEGLPPVQITTPKGNTQNMFTAKYLCTKCHIVMKSKYQTSKHRHEFHPQEKYKNIFKTISEPVEDRKSKVKPVPVVTIEGLNRIIVPDNNNTKKTESSPHKSLKYKALAGDRTFLNKPNSKQYTNHWRTQHRDLDKSKKAFVAEHIPVCEKNKNTESVTQKAVEVSRKRKANESPKDQTKQRRMSQMEPERVTERQGDNNANTSNDRDPRVQSIYQCGRCLLHFISINTLEVHFETCESQSLNAMDCGKCGLSFSSDEIITHIYRDHLFERSPKFNILKVLPKSSHTNSASKEDSRKVNLFMCSVCRLHFVDESSLRSHFFHQVHNQPHHSCKICHYTFCQTSLNHHEVLHHDKMGLTHNDFNVITKNFEIETSKSNHTTVEMSTGKVPTAKTKDINISSDSEESVISISEDGNEANSELEEWTSSQEGKDLPLAMKLLRFIKRQLKNNMNKCKKCSKIFYTKSKRRDSTCSKCTDIVTDSRQQHQDVPVTASHGSDLTGPGQERGTGCNPNDRGNIFKCSFCSIHFTASSTLNKHLSIEAHDAEIRINCPICNLVFSAESLSRHTKIHHKELNLTIEDFKIISRNAPVNRDSIGMMQPIGNIRPDNQVQPSTSDGRLNVEEHKILYKCTICNIHFIERGTWRCHLANKKSHRTKTNTKCTICHLSFSRKCIRKHIKLHHTLFKLKRKDFVIIKNTHKIQHKAQNVSKSGKERAEQVEESSTKLPQSLRKATDSVNPDACQNVIYRCKECDVYFIKESICLQHCHEHMALGRLDYLNCPECNLQFESDSIGAHRKKHHSKGNNLQAVVKTHQPHKRMVNGDNDICCVMQLQPNDEIVRPDTVELVSNSSIQVITCKIIKVIDKTIQEVEMQNAENNDSEDTRTANKDNTNEFCTVSNIQQNCHENMNTTKIQNLRSPQTASVIDENIQTSMEIQSAGNDVIGVVIETNDKSVFEVTEETVGECPRTILEQASHRFHTDIAETKSQQSSHNDPENSDSITIEATVRESRETSDMTNIPIPSKSTSTQAENIFSEEMSQNQTITNELESTIPNTDEYFKDNNIEVSCNSKDEVKNTDAAENLEQDIVNKTEAEDYLNCPECNLQFEKGTQRKTHYSKDNNLQIDKTIQEVEMQNAENNDSEDTRTADKDDTNEFCTVSNIHQNCHENMNTTKIQNLRSPRTVSVIDENIQTSMEIQSAENDMIGVAIETNDKSVFEVTEEIVRECPRTILELASHRFHANIAETQSQRSSHNDPEKFDITIEATVRESRETSYMINIASKSTSTQAENIFSEEMSQNHQTTTNEFESTIPNTGEDFKDNNIEVSCYSNDEVENIDAAENIENEIVNKTEDVKIDDEDTMCWWNSQGEIVSVSEDEAITLTEFETTRQLMKSDVEQGGDISNAKPDGANIATVSEKINDLIEVNDCIANPKNIIEHDGCQPSMPSIDDENIIQSLDKPNETPLEVQTYIDDSNIRLCTNGTLEINNEHTLINNHQDVNNCVEISEPSNQSKSIVIGKVAKNVFQLIENTLACNEGTPIKQTLTIHNPLDNLPGDIETETHNNSTYFDKPCYENANTISQKKHKILDGEINKENNPISEKGVRELERDSNKLAEHVSTKIRGQTSEDNQNPFMVYIPDRLLGQIQDKESFLTITEKLIGDLKNETIEDDYHDQQKTMAGDDVNETMATVACTEFGQTCNIKDKSDENNELQTKDSKESDSNRVESANISFDNNTIPRRENTKQNEAGKPECSDNHSVSRSPKIPLNSIIKDEGVEIIDEGIEYIDFDADDDVIFVSTSTEENVITVYNSDDESDKIPIGRKSTCRNITMPQPIIWHVCDDESTNDDVTVKREKYEQSDIRKYFKQ